MGLQPADMAVDELAWETLCIRCDGMETVLIDRAGALGRDKDIKAQGPPEGAPERQRLPVGEHKGKSDGDALFAVDLFKRIFPGEEGLPDLKEVDPLSGAPAGGLLSLFRPALLFRRPSFVCQKSFKLSRTQDTAPLTPVAGDPGITCGKGDDTAAAVVFTALTDKAVDLGEGEGPQGFKSYEGRGLAALLHLLFGGIGGADRPHEARIGSAHDFAAYVLLHSPQDSVVAEGSALYHDPVSQGVQTADPDDLGKHVFYNGTAETGQDIIHFLAVFLLGDDPAVHKNGTAAAELRRVLRPEGPFRDLIRGNSHVAGEILQERTASRGAGFVDDYVRDDAVIQPDGFHVLSADIKDKGGILQIFGAGARMGDGLDNVLIRAEGLCGQQFTITRRGHAFYENIDPFPGVFFIHFQKAALEDRDGVASVIGIIRIQDAVSLIEQDKFGGGAPAVYSQPDTHPGAVLFDIQFPENMFILIQGMAGQKFPVLLRGGKKRSGESPGLCIPSNLSLHAELADAQIQITGHRGIVRRAACRGC